MEELYTPQAGPDAPNKTAQSKAMRNMLSGYAEKEHISDFAFETQRKTYHSFGYAQDPSKPITEEDVGVDKQVNISCSRYNSLGLLRPKLKYRILAILTYYLPVEV